ncbi:hypothetical protein D9M71_171240 [compost metagenome]
MLEQVEEFGRGVVLLPGALHQPLLIGIGQRPVGPAEAEHRRGQGRRLAGFLHQVFHLADGEAGRQWPAQAQRLAMGRSALAEAVGPGPFALQQQERLQQLEGLRLVAQAPAQRESGIPACGCHVLTSLSASTSTVRTKRLAVA